MVKSYIYSICFICIFCSVQAAANEKLAAESITEPLRMAETYFAQGDFHKAIEKLHEIRSMTGPIPQMTVLDQKIRARIFFDLGCCYLAKGDSTQAEAALQSAFHIDSNLKRGFFPNASPGNFWQNLLNQKEQARRLKTKRLQAGMRSFVFPGWGQHYRGYRKKGVILGGMSLAVTGYWIMKHVAFKSARSKYEQTVKSDVLPNVTYRDDNGMYSEFEARHRTVKQEARRANQVLGILGGIWVLSIFDSVLWAPNQVQFNIHF